MDWFLRCPTMFILMTSPKSQLSSSRQSWNFTRYHQYFSEVFFKLRLSPETSTNKNCTNKKRLHEKAKILLFPHSGKRSFIQVGFLVVDYSPTLLVYHIWKKKSSLFMLSWFYYSIFKYQCQCGGLWITPGDNLIFPGIPYQYPFWFLPIYLWGFGFWKISIYVEIGSSSEIKNLTKWLKCGVIGGIQHQKNT